MSDSKANKDRIIRELEAALFKAETDIVFLLQALFDIHDDNPSVDLPNLGDNRFAERIWRQVSVHG